MAAQKTFKGYAVSDPKKWTDLCIVEYPSKRWEETDVEIAITHCGVCASDIHTISGGWGPMKLQSMIGGFMHVASIRFFDLSVASHEIAGTAVRVGSKVQGIKVGDRVGVGAQIGSCYKCKYCTSDNEQYCPKMIDTYNAKYPDGLVRNGAGPGKLFGIIGVGGLGHYAVMFAKALGAEVYAFTHQHGKEADIKKMGADHVVIPETGFHVQYRVSFDLIISTRDTIKGGSPLEQYLTMLDMHGKFISVGLPDDSISELTPAAFLPNGCFFGGSHIGSKKEVLRMLALADQKGIKPWVEELPMKDVKKAVEGLKDKKVRYWYVLKQDIA